MEGEEGLEGQALGSVWVPALWQGMDKAIQDGQNQARKDKDTSWIGHLASPHHPHPNSKSLLITFSLVMCPLPDRQLTAPLLTWRCPLQTQVGPHIKCSSNLGSLTFSAQPNVYFKGHSYITCFVLFGT